MQKKSCNLQGLGGLHSSNLEPFSKGYDGSCGHNFIF